MPRAGWVKPETDQRLSDHISLGVLTRVFPPHVVDRVLTECGRVERRHRLLPARAVVYYVMGLALFSTSSYEEVMRMLVAGHSWSGGWAQPWTVPSKVALAKARARLGSEPLQSLFDRVAVPMGTQETVGAFYRFWRVISIDGMCLDLAETPDNVEEFGRPPSSRGVGIGGFPQVRVMALAEAGTHAIVDAALASIRVGEQTLALQVLRSLQPGMLLLADRGFLSYPLWVKASATGADLLWRVRSHVLLPVGDQHSDGSYSSTMYPSTKARRNDVDGVPVRVVEYTISADGRDPIGYRLVTTILDPAKAPADELTALYSERWEIESAFDELKTHQRSPRVVLRSKTPDGVRQEVYGYLCVHYAIRWLMHDTARGEDTDPDRVSFTRTLRAARRTTVTHPGFSPHSDD